MGTFTFNVDSFTARPGYRSVEITVEDSVADIVTAVGESELLDYIGKAAAVKYFEIEEAE